MNKPTCDQSSFNEHDRLMLLKVNKKMANLHFKELSEGLLRQLNEGALVDAEIKAHGNAVKIHKIVLAMFSLHIREANMAEKRMWQIDAPGYSEEDIKNFVKFLYNGEAEIGEKCPEIIRTLHFDLCVDQKIRKKKVSVSKGEQIQIVINLELKYLRNLTFEMGVPKLLTEHAMTNLKDISIKTGKHLHRCHKVILSAMSDYFSVMFMCGLKEADDDIVDLKGIETETFAAILAYIYTGKSPVTAANAQEMLSMSVYLQMKSLQMHCEEFLLQNICERNCIDLLQSAELYHCSRLSVGALSFIVNNFHNMNKLKFVRKLELHHVISIAKNDNLNVDSETEVLQFAMDWIKHNKAEECTEIVLSNVRLTLVDPNILKKILEQVKDFPNVQSVSKLLKIAIENQALGNLEEDPRREKAIVVLKRSSSFYGMELASYSLSRKTWYKLSDCPTCAGGTGFAACATDNHIYVTGGTAPTKSFHQYSVKRNEWLKLEEMHDSRNAHCMGHVQDVIYVLGGSSITNGAFNVVESIEKYVIGKKTWSKVGNMAIPTYDSACAVMKSRILVFGGSIGCLSGVYIKDIQCFDTVTETCTTLYHHLPFTLSLAVACVNNRDIYITCPNGKIVYYNEESPPTVFNLTQCSQLMGYATVYENNALYILGGYSMVGESDAIYKFDIKTKRQSVFSETKVPFKKQTNQLYAAIMYMSRKHLDTEFPTMKDLSPRRKGQRL